MLKYYGLAAQHAQIREWYDGYRFGDTDLYCPWDVLNHADLLRAQPGAKPQAYWMNSSGNAILRTLLRKAAPQTRRELEALVNGECVTKKISQELTYRELYDSIDNLWSVLFTTGYLTWREETDRSTYRLAIPNREIREIFTEQILSWFQEEARKDAPVLDAFCGAFKKGDAAAAEKQFTAYWDISSNAESGDGYSDIQAELWEDEIGIIIEIKYPDNGDLEDGCREALEQIERKRYEERLMQDGMKTILKYGIACYKKSCKVQLGQSFV